MLEYVDCEAYDLEIDLTLLTPEEGGRPSGRGIRSGYRCLMDIAGSSWTTAFYLQDGEWLYPGETAKAFVVTTAPQLMLEHFTLETPLLLREGGRLVGRGHIIKLLNLEQHATEARRREEERAKRETEAHAQQAAKEQEERFAQFQAEALARQEKAAQTKRNKAALAKREKGHVQPTRKTPGNRLWRRA